MSTTCSACGHENRDGRRFCTQCGVPLATRCPACGATTEPDERFCGDCGASLTATQASAPASAEAVPASAERKHITVLFADVAGSMDLQERLDAEVWAQIMGRFVSILAEGVRKFGGTVDKFTGDGIMALFGAPVAQEDHARRACHAAWHLTKAIGEYSGELRQEQGVELHVRLGLNSGEVVVGRVGDDVTLDPTALGHTVGLAQRMEGMAEPGGVYLSGHTARLVEGWFSLDDLGRKRVKGSREQLRVYALGGPSPSPPVLHGAGLGVAPLVGREQELAVLEDALAMTEEGQAQVIGVVGDAGVGKSRLCDEFARSAAERGITVRRTAGVSHGRDVPMLPILALLRDYFGIIDVDSAERAREKIARRLVDLDPALEESLPLVYDFLGVGYAHQPIPPMAPEVRMRRVFEAVRCMTLRRSGREPLVLLFEDVHWFDPHSRAFLEGLIESLPGSRTLVVTNFRPEFTVSWMGPSYYRQLPLSPLGEAAVGDLLVGLAGTHPSLGPLVEFVRERTAGNPFFVEEMVRTLVEDGTLTGTPGNYRLARPVTQVKMPPNIQAVLAARIDRLLPDHKAILQTAAVVGRTFASTVLAKVTGLADEALEHVLRALCAAELVHQPHAALTTDYQFWHPLTQEVAYGSLLGDRRRRLHRTVASAIIQLDSERLDEHAPLIASHFERGGEHFEAARWNAQAAVWAWRTDLNEAARRLRSTIWHLDRVPESGETLRLAIHAQARLLHLAGRNIVRMDEADGLYAEARTLAERLGDPRLFAHVTAVYGSLQFGRGDVQQGFESFLEARRATQPHPDDGVPAVVLIALPFAYRYIGPVDKALSLAEEAIRFCQGDPRIGMEEAGYSLLGYSRLTRCEILLLTGRLREARQDARHVLDLATAYSPGELVVFTLTLFPRLSSYAGDEDHCLAQAREAVRIADDLGSARARIRAIHGLAVAQLSVNRYEEAAALLTSALDEARAGNVGRFEEAALLSYLARAHIRLDDREAARRCADDAVEVAQCQGARVVECLAVLNRAQVGRAIHDDPNSVLADLDAASDLVKATGATIYEPSIREELGRMEGDEVQLREALCLYERVDATGHARRLERELTASSGPMQRK
jgi:class 3 adenylate cyclase/tetratricopeptide (TPR) repeat protein